MRSPVPSRRRLVASTALTALMATLLAIGVNSAAGAAAAPGAMPAFGPVIEDYPVYQGQTTCSPSAKPGTAALQRWLVARYPGTGTSGIVRGCSVGGRSEHKEGRAFDWRVSVTDPRQRAQAETLIALLRAADGHGNENAVARRMGIMYWIWNDRIYSSSSHYAPRPYVHGGCRTVALAACGATLRHRDHVHISMSWAGALGRTSFWDGSVSGTLTPPQAPPPEPPPLVPPPEPSPVVKPVPVVKPPPKPAPVWPPLLDQVATPAASVPVPASGTGVTTSFSLAAGRTYRLLATGYYAYGAGSQVADAACSWHVRDDGGWSSAAEGSTSATALKLTVGGRSGWRARDGGRCDQDEHVYVWDYTPTRTGAVTVLLDDPTRADDAGALELRVLLAGADVSEYTTRLPDLAPEPSAPPASGAGEPLTGTEVLSVDAARGGRTAAVLQAGHEYVVEVGGTWSAGEGIEADAECSRTTNGAWQPRRSSDPLHPSIDSFDLYADGVDLVPLRSGCDAGHLYRYRLIPNRTSQVSLATWDATPGDDVGALQVTVWPRAR